MAWLEKTAHTPFDDHPVEGLWYLDGDRVGQAAPALDWRSGQKYALIAFPAGTFFPLTEASQPDNPTIQLTEQLALPIHTSLVEGILALYPRLEPGIYDLQPQNDHTLDLRGPDFHVQLIYDNTRQRLTDIIDRRPSEAALAALHELEVLDANENVLERTAARDAFLEAYESVEEAASVSGVLDFLTPGVQRTLFANPSPEPSPLSEATADALLAQKDAILAAFQQLPPQHQATFTLVILKTVIDGAWGTWLYDVLALTYFHDALLPDVNREDLRAIQISPEAIAHLSDADLATITRRMREQYRQELFWEELPFHVEAVFTDKQQDSRDGA